LRIRLLYGGVIIKTTAHWSGDPIRQAAHDAAILETLGRTDFYTMTPNPSAGPIGRELRNKHFLRKHGKNAHYGQEGKKK
jgi:L-ribulose-5-phosphate 4-epimerase